MSEDFTKDPAAAGFGSLEGAEATAPETASRGRPSTRKVGGKAQAALGSAEQIVGAAADRVGDAVGQLRDQTKAAADRTSEAARTLQAAVDPFVRERPYAAVGLGVVIGLLAGLLLAGRGPKVIYVKPPTA